MMVLREEQMHSLTFREGSAAPEVGLFRPIVKFRVLATTGGMGGRAGGRGGGVKGATPLGRCMGGYPLMG